MYINHTHHRIYQTTTYNMHLASRHGTDRCTAPLTVLTSKEQEKDKELPQAGDPGPHCRNSVPINRIRAIEQHLTKALRDNRSRELPQEAMTHIQHSPPLIAAHNAPDAL
jgi:hypothetical protein